MEGNRANNPQGQSEARSKSGKIWLTPSQHLVRRCLFNNSMFKLLVVLILLGDAACIFAQAESGEESLFKDPKKQQDLPELLPHEISDIYDFEVGEVCHKNLEKPEVCLDDDIENSHGKLENDGIEVSLRSILQVIIRSSDQNNHDKEKDILDNLVTLIPIMLGGVRDNPAVHWARVLQDFLEKFDDEDPKCRKRLVCEILENPDLYGAKRFSGLLQSIRDFSGGLLHVPSDLELRGLSYRYIYGELMSYSAFSSSCSEMFQCPFSIKDAWNAAERERNHLTDITKEKDLFGSPESELIRRMMGIMYVFGLHRMLPNILSASFRFDFSDLSRCSNVMDDLYREVDPDNYASNLLTIKGWKKLTEKLGEKFDYADEQCQKRMMCEATKGFFGGNCSSELTSKIPLVKKLMNLIDQPDQPDQPGIPGQPDEGYLDAIGLGCSSTCGVFACHAFSEWDALRSEEVTLHNVPDSGSIAKIIITGLKNLLHEPSRMLLYFLGPSKEDLSNGAGISLVDSMTFLRELFKGSDYNNVECQQRLICELMKEPEKYSRVAVWAKEAFQYAEYLKFIGLPEMFEATLMKYVHAELKSYHRNGCEFFSCDYSVKEAVRRLMKD